MLTVGNDGDTEKYEWLEQNEEIQGYVVSLTEEETTWCNAAEIPNYTQIEGNGSSTAVLNNFGLKRTLSIIEKTAPDRTIANKAREWQAQAPASSSGWYLPSANKLTYIIKNYKVINESLDKCAGAQKILTNKYWSNNTYNKTSVYIKWRANNTTTSPSTKNNEPINNTNYLRPFLTFTNPRK